MISEGRRSLTVMYNFGPLVKGCMYILPMANLWALMYIRIFTMMDTVGEVYVFILLRIWFVVFFPLRCLNYARDISRISVSTESRN